jgi:hypothetical protein
VQLAEVGAKVELLEEDLKSGVNLIQTVRCRLVGGLGVQWSLAPSSVFPHSQSSPSSLRCLPDRGRASFSLTPFPLISLTAQLEVCSKKSLGRYTKLPKIPTHALENLTLALKFLEKEGLKYASKVCTHI